MNGEGCWSTVVCRPAERVALGLAPESEWLLQCRLGLGHSGNHATDASVRPRHDRRLWLEWNDFDNRAQSLIDRNPCPVPSPEGAGCVFFAGHGGPHFYARSNGHVPSAMSAAPGQGHHTGAQPTGGYPLANPPVSEPPYAGPPLSGPSGPPLSGPQTGPHTPAPMHPAPGGPIPAPPTMRTGAHHFPDPPAHVAPQPPVAPPPPQPVAQQPAAPDAAAYRGGRRSTNTEPPVDGHPVHQAEYEGRRRRSEDGGSASGEISLDRGEREAQIGAALEEVANAIAKLAAVLRQH